MKLKTLLKITVFALILPGVAFAQASFNPSTAADNLTDFVAMIMKSAVTLALPFVGVYIIYSGFLFLLAQGNQEKLTRAKENFLWVIVGSCLILGAWMFAEILGKTADRLTGRDTAAKTIDKFKKF